MEIILNDRDKLVCSTRSIYQEHPSCNTVQGKTVKSKLAARRTVKSKFVAFVLHRKEPSTNKSVTSPALSGLGRAQASGLASEI